MKNVTPSRDGATDSMSGQLPEAPGSTPGPATNPHRKVQRQMLAWLIFALGVVIAIATVGPFGLALWMIFYINIVIRYGWIRL